MSARKQWERIIFILVCIGFGALWAGSVWFAAIYTAGP